MVHITLQLYQLDQDLVDDESFQVLQKAGQLTSPLLSKVPSAIIIEENKAWHSKYVKLKSMKARDHNYETYDP